MKRRRMFLQRRKLDLADLYEEPFTNFGANAVSFNYDQDGLLTQAGAMTITRDPANGRISGTQLGNVTTSQTYNSTSELATYEAKFGATTLFATSYTRDSLGRISQLAETVQGIAKTFRYAYDTTGRLERVWRNDTLISTYTYDGNGNRLSHTTLSGTTTGTYDSQDRLVSYGAASYVYTANGELQAKIEGNDTTRYTYDAFGNLVQVKMPNGDIIEYIIDAQNRRAGKKFNGVLVKRWLYEGQLRPVAELDSAGNVTARFVYGMKVNVPEYVVKGAVTYRVITDHLGGVRLVVNHLTAAVVQRMDYDEWGNVLTDSNPDFTPFGFAGGFYDNRTMVTRFGVRDYHAGIARWGTRDPVGFIASTNLYCYVSSDPLNFKDFSGLIKLHAKNATKQQTALFSNAFLDMYKAVKGNQRVREYFKRFGVDIEDALCPGKGPDVYLEPSKSDRYGYYNSLTNNIVLEKLNDEKAIAATLIHELGHWANDYGTWFGDVNPDISDIRFTSPNPKDPPYGYAAEMVTFGFIY